MPVRLLLCVLFLVSLAACASKRILSADEYYREATTAFESKNYDVAINRYKELLDQHPFSEHAEEAELRIARSYYRSKRYAEAIAAFNDFQRMHPMSPQLPRVYYLLGRSYMDQMSTIDRDQAAAENAHGWFRVVLDRYPASRYVPRVRRHLATCRQALASHELQIANYYFKRDNLRAGENRVKGLLEKYPDTEATDGALLALAAAYARAGEGEHERMARAALAERRANDANGARPAGEVLAGVSEVRHGAATAALFDDLVERYGSAAESSVAVTVPVLRDPESPATGGIGDPGFGPLPGTDPGAY